MQITRLSIKKVIPDKGLVGFCSLVLDDSLCLNNIAIFSRLNQTTYRLVFPEKKIADKTIPLFYPVTNNFYRQLEDEVNKKFNI